MSEAPVQERAKSTVDTAKEKLSQVTASVREQAGRAGEVARERYDAACIVSRVAMRIDDVESCQNWMTGLCSRVMPRGLSHANAEASSAALLSAMREHSDGTWTAEHEAAFGEAFGRLFRMLCREHAATEAPMRFKMAA